MIISCIKHKQQTRFEAKVLREGKQLSQKVKITEK